MLEVAVNVRALRTPSTEHWIPEEKPQALATALLEFVRK